MTEVRSTCAATRMADDISETLTELIAAERGLSLMAAKELITGLRDTGRYQSDVWGPTRFFSEGMVCFEDKAACQTRDWLNVMLVSSPRQSC